MNRRYDTLKTATYFACALLFLMISFLSSCKEDTGGLGANALPGSDAISAFQTDTSTLVTSMYLKLKDSLPTNNVSVGMLGSYNDPVFGNVKASIYASVSSTGGGGSAPWNGQIGGKDTGVVDSAVLELSIANYYGTPGQQTFLVYQLQNYINSGQPYYAHATIPYINTPIGILQAVPNIKSSAINIKLSHTFLQQILTAINNNPNYYSLYFDSLVKGLYITVSNTPQLSGQGAIYSISLGGSNLDIYYHGSTVPQAELISNFPLGYPTFFNHFDLNHSTAPFSNEHTTGPQESIDGNNFVYVQTMGGPVGRINFPNLYQNWLSVGPIIINKAEIVVTVDMQECRNPYSPPPAMDLWSTDSSGILHPLPDVNSITGYYNNTYNPSNYTYTYVITQYMQDVVSHKTVDYGLIIAPASDVTSANRVVLYGAQNPRLTSTPGRMKLIMYYTPVSTHKATKH